MKRFLSCLIIGLFIFSVMFVGLACKTTGQTESSTVAAETTALTETTVAGETTSAETTTAPAGTAAEDYSIILGENQIIRSFDPAKLVSGQEQNIANNIYDTLVVFNKDDPSKPIGNVAEKWDVSSDAKEWTFYLRKGIKFTTGNELTADDVIYSFKRGMLLNSPNYPPYGSYIDADTGFTKIDDYTVKITLKAPYAGFIYLIMNSHVGVLDSKTLTSKITAEDPLGSLFLNDNSIGSGPFYLKSWERDQKVVLEKNENYWGIKAGFFRVPKYKNFISVSVKEPTTLNMMLQKGDIDFTWELTKDILDTYKNDTNKDIRVEQFPSYVGTDLIMNFDYKPFQDPKVRQAVRYAIDYNSMIDNLMDATRMDSPIFTPMLGSGGDIIINYDLEKAKQLMSESAYPNGFEVGLVIGTGVGLGAEWESVALKEKEDLAKIGIKVNIEQYDWAVTDEKLFSGNYQLLQNWFGATYPEAQALYENFVLTDTVPRQHNPWRNAELEKLVVQARTETDVNKRKELFLQVNKGMAEDGPNAFIAQQVSSFVFRSNVFGWDGNPYLGDFDFSVLYKK